MGHRPSCPCHLFHHLQVGCHLDWMLGYPTQLSQKIAAQLPQSVGAHHYFCELGAVAVLAGLEFGEAISGLI